MDDRTEACTMCDQANTDYTLKTTAPACVGGGGDDDKDDAGMR